MKQELSVKFQEFGIYFEDILIVNVIIPQDLREVLGQATTFDVHLQNQIQSNKNVVIKLENEERLKLAALKKENQKVMADLVHVKECNEIDAEEQRIRQETDMMVEEVIAEKHKNMNVI